VIVGVCKAKLGFEGNAVIYTTFDNATRFTPTGRERISYVLVKVKDGIPVQTVKEAIKALGDVDAFTSDEFRLKTKAFIVVATGIGINFAVTIVLGLVVGLLLSASIFYQFTVENLRYFAVLKAMGARTPTLTGMILIQAIVVGVIGFGIGGGVAGMFAMVLNKAESELQAEFPWWLYVGSFVATIITIMLASLISVRRVVGVSPGQVFAS
jgi:putative ABC transport system permease protein